MKKLFFILCILLNFSTTLIMAAESPTLMKSMMARFEAFKQYLFQKKEVINIPLQAPTTTTPIVFYYPKKNDASTAQIVLINAETNNSKINTNLPSNTFNDVNSYDFSPKKQYLLVHETTAEGIVSRVGGDWFGKQVTASSKSKLINTITRQEITVFNNKIIMHEFSPDETTLLIASPQKSWRETLGRGSNTKGASPSGSNLPRAGRRQQSATGEILRYDLFDINSKKILKTFENIQSITYVMANKLFIKYDDGTMEIVSIEENSQTSLLSKFFNLFVQQPTIQIQSTPTTHDSFNIRTEYDEKQKNFTLQINDNKELTYPLTTSYHLSPRNQFILIEQLSTTTVATMESIQKNITGTTIPNRTTTKLIDLISGKEITTFENVITHEFSQDESRLLVLCTQPISFVMQLTSSDYLYRLYDTTKENTELIQWDKTTQSAYFSSSRELTIIDKNGNLILYDPLAATTFQDIHRQKTMLLNEDFNKELRAKKVQKEQEALMEKNAQAAQQDKQKQAIFDTLTPTQQVALTREQLPIAEIKKRNEFTSPINAVKERGFSSLMQLASETTSEVITGIKKYLWPTSPEQLPQTVEDAFAKVTNDIALIEKQIQPQPPIHQDEIEEINSPAIQEEQSPQQQQLFITLVQDVRKLDTMITKLPSLQWPIWQEKQLALLEPAKSILKNAVQQTINSSWQKHGTTILNLAVQATLAGTTSALGMFAYQAAQTGTGNLDNINTNILIVGFLSAASANLLTASSKAFFTNSAAQTALSATGSNLVSQALFSPSIESKKYQLQIPSFRGVINSWIINEGITTVNTMLQQNGGIANALKRIDIKRVLINKELAPTSNALVANIVPQIQNITGNEKLALALTEIGWIFFQSAALGGLFWSAGLGYAGTSMAESINYAVLTGMAQGTLANLVAITTQTTPSTVLTISTIPVSQQLLALAGSTLTETPQTVLAGVFQAVGTEATNFIINESDKAGGLLEALQKGKDALGSAISSRWSDLWASVSDAWETIQEIEPLPV